MLRIRSFRSLATATRTGTRNLGSERRPGIVLIKKMVDKPDMGEIASFNKAKLKKMET